MRGCSGRSRAVATQSLGLRRVFASPAKEARLPAMKLQSIRIHTPIGDLLAFTRLGSLYALAFAEHRLHAQPELERRLGAFAIEESDPLGLRATVEAYFAGELEALDAVAVETGGTPFQRSVWTAVRQIPSGCTASYGEVARAVGRARAVRAVGGANGRNPIVLVIPCHRVVCSDGSLGGYGAGLSRKRWLLQHEKVLLPLT